MYKCSICGRSAGFMPPSGECPICGKSCTYYPVFEPVTVTTAPPRRPAPTPPVRTPPKAQPPKQIKTETKREKPPSKPEVKKPKAKAQWSWWAAIISFFLGTGAGINELGLDRDAALIFGGVVGLVFGYHYKKLIVIAIIAFIAYSLLQKQ